MRKYRATVEDTVGLSDAYKGKIEGLDQFLFFVARNLRAVGLADVYAEPINAKLKSLASEVDAISHFVSGFRAGASAKVSR